MINMEFKERYTTNEKINIEAANKEIKEKIETTKTILSNDAYALGEILTQFNMSIQNLIRSLAK